MDESERNKLATTTLRRPLANITNTVGKGDAAESNNTATVGQRWGLEASQEKGLLNTLPPRPWRTKSEKQRLRVFVIMAKGGSVSPADVPTPELRGE